MNVMIKYCPLTRSEYGYGRDCLLEECVLYDEKEDMCLIKKALERYIDSSLGDIIKQKIKGE